MGIFSFLKKAFKEPEKESEEKEKKITLSEVEDAVQEKEGETEKREKHEIKKIEARIKEFTEEIKDKITILNEVNVEAKEKNEKVKSTVNEGRKKYTEHLEKLIESLEDVVNFGSIGKVNLKKVTEDINSAFIRFNTHSGKSYERATILIGKEMGSIKEAMKKFSTELIELFNEDQELISTSKKLTQIKSKLEELKKIDEELIKSEEELKNIILDINTKEKLKKERQENLDRIKKSQEYLDNLEKKNNLEFRKNEIRKEIQGLRTMIDFKGLSNFYHIFEDRMEVVKRYRDNFSEEFREDNGNRLLNLLNESKLNTEEIYDKIKQIKEWREELEKKKKEIKPDETVALSSEIESGEAAVKESIKEKEWAESKKQGILETKKNMLDSIKKNLKQVGIILEE